jgi:hypothetical protein
MEKKMKTLIFALVLIGSQTAGAAATDIWEGSGTLFELQGKPTGTYDLLVENTRNGDQTQSQVTVTLADGTIYKQQCLITQKVPGKWISECDHGKGGGACLGEGLCLSYEEDSSGKAYATTIVIDGPADMRLVRTELQSGQAVRFFREKLHKR